MSNPIYKLVKNNYYRRIVNESDISKEQLEEVIKFHQATTMVPLVNINNIDRYNEREKWRDFIGQIEPDINLYTERKIYIPKRREDSNSRQMLPYSDNYEITKENLREILSNVFSTINITGEKKNIIPLVVVLDNKSIKDISVGCYMFNFHDFTLNKVKEWGEDEIAQIRSIFSSGQEPLYNTAICYAIDMQKAALLYGKRGYRNTLIEIGDLKRSFEKTLDCQQGNLSSICDYRFPDNAVSRMFGTNVRLAPVVLIQWFGKKERR